MAAKARRPPEGVDEEADARPMPEPRMQVWAEMGAKIVAERHGWLAVLTDRTLPPAGNVGGAPATDSKLVLGGERPGPFDRN